MIQKTIKKEISFSGIGIHTGKIINVCLTPLPEDSGIIFKRNRTIKLDISNITNVKRAITIGRDKNRIMTIEHLLATIFMCGITNILINVDDGEIPVLDGSALKFIQILKKAGIKEQNRRIKPIKIKKTIVILRNDRFIAVLPSRYFGITYHINFPHPELSNRFISFERIDFRTFKREIAPARTFGFYKEVKDLLRQGFARGGSLDNAVVLTDNGYLNKKLRFRDECLRHKVLDLIGSIAILGRPIIAHFIAYRSGHSLDIEMIKEIKRNIK